ncbi:MAG TPA: nickel-binding protein [Gaiellaceae bacterium]
MPTYVVERYLPDLTTEEVLVLLERLRLRRVEASAANPDVTYLDSTLLPEDDTCFCRFAATSANAVAELNRRAGCPFARVVPVLVLPRVVNPAGHDEIGSGLWRLLLSIIRTAASRWRNGAGTGTDEKLRASGSRRPYEAAGSLSVVDADPRGSLQGSVSGVLVASATVPPSLARSFVQKEVAMCQVKRRFEGRSRP